MKRQMKFLSFWSINDGVQTAPLCEQMLEMQKHGIEGVVFHPRFYPGGPNYMTPEFIKVVGEVILYAKAIGMEFWIYDENGWPSGAADGQVLAKHPDSKRWGLVCVEEKDLRFDDKVLCRHGKQIIAARGAAGVSPLCRETTETFLELTHERYWKELPLEAFDYVTGFFCDEVDYFPGHLLAEGAVPWCPEFESYYTEKYGVSPCGELWKLFDTAGEHPDFKIRFWETAGDLIAKNFYKPYEAWCEKHGKLFTGHLKGEESPYFQLMFSGSCFMQLKNLSLPAIDTLERYHGNHFFPQLLTSVAAQQGRVGCLAEAMGGAGWGVSPDDLVKYMLWLAQAGVERVVLHLGQFALKARAIRDWPPSVPLHLSWHDAFADILGEIRHLAEPLLSAAWDAPHILIVTPTRGVMAHYEPRHAASINLHDGTGIPDSASARINAAFLEMVEDCYAAGWKYHFTEERELGEAKIEDGKLYLGAMTYEKVVLSDGCLFVEDEVALVDALREADMLLPPPARVKKTKVTVPMQTYIVPEQSAWQIDFPKENQLLLEWQTTPSGDLRAEIPVKDVTAPVMLAFSDPIAEVRTNAKVCAADDSRKRFFLTEIGAVLTLEVRSEATEALPFVWLLGDFAVMPQDSWREFDDRQVSCEGRFLIDGTDGAKKLRAGELITQGLPFFSGLLAAKKTFVLPEAKVCRLDFDAMRACAVHVTIDGREIGWWWQDHPITVDLADGEHQITILAAPSTYNMYGPHHYYLGDCRLTSPDTFFGRGGYTDNADAPANTFIDTMQFVKFAVDGNVILKK